MKRKYSGIKMTSMSNNWQVHLYYDDYDAKHWFTSLIPEQIENSLAFMAIKEGITRELPQQWKLTIKTTKGFIQFGRGSR